MKLTRLLRTLLCIPILAHAADGQIHEKTLSNGLKVILKEDHRSPVVVSQVWYKVGSSYEPNGITGISHMLEHMMFKGTDDYPQGEFSKIIAENGGEQNAFTGEDYTAYYQTLEKSRLEVSFKLESDRMRNLHLLPEELKKELEVVTEERRMRTDDQPRAKMHEHFKAVAFANSPYKNPVIGWPQDIAAYQVEDLQAWYQRWYAPNNATLVVVGDIEPEATFDLAERYFGKLPTSEIKPLKLQAEVEQLGLRKLTVKVPAKLPYLMMGYKVPSLKTGANESEVYALEVLAGVLSGGDSARLDSHLVRGKQLLSSVGVNFGLASRLDDLFVLEATPAEGKSMQEVEQALRAEIKQLQTQLVTEQELKRIKAQVLANNVYERDSNFYQGMLLGAFETVGLGWQKYDEYVSKVSAVTAEQIREAARKYFTDDHLTIAYLEPQPIPQNTKPAQVTGGNHVH